MQSVYQERGGFTQNSCSTWRKRGMSDFSPKKSNYWTAYPLLQKKFHDLLHGYRHLKVWNYNIFFKQIIDSPLYSKWAIDILPNDNNSKQKWALSKVILLVNANEECQASTKPKLHQRLTIRPIRKRIDGTQNLVSKMIGTNPIFSAISGRTDH